MKIGELARRSGLTASRIRFYETAGLLQAVERQPNGYRSYPAEALLILEIIASAQHAGFSLDEIRALLPADLSAWAHDDLLQALHRKVQEIETLESRLRASKANLQALIADIQNKPEGLDCADNAKRVLARVRGGMVALSEPSPASPPESPSETVPASPPARPSSPGSKGGSRAGRKTGSA